MKNNAKDLQKAIETILPILVNYIQESQSGDGKVLEQPKASNLANSLEVRHLIEKGGWSVEQMNSWVKNYLAYSQHMQHPQYIGHQVSASHMASAVADFIQGVINNPMAIYEMGPSAAVIEGCMINWMLQKVGWFKGSAIDDFTEIEGNGSGVFTHGGSMANLTAMLAARSHADSKIWNHGYKDDLVVLGTEVAHYSVSRALSIMGLGQQALEPVSHDHREVLDPDGLMDAYLNAKRKGKKVMAVVANACATSTGLYDPIKEISQFCKENNLWFHVDGAHGASALLTDDYRHYMDGVKDANSMIWDTHKMLWTTTLSAAVLFKDSSTLHQTFQQKGSYLFHEKEKPGFDLMPYTIECTKSAIATKLFWVLAAEGEKGLGQYVQRRFDVTHQMYDYINSHPDFECPYQPEANILCFRYTKGKPDNAFQLALRNALVKDGDFYITSTEILGQRYLRLTVINDLTNVDHIKKLLDKLIHIARRLSK